MAQGVKISELKSAVDLFEDTQIPIVNLGETQKSSYALLRNKILADAGYLNIVLEKVLATDEVNAEFVHFAFDRDDVAVEVYTNKYGFNPISIDTSVSGKITLIFPEHTEEVTVRVLIKSFYVSEV